ncbi:precorrin-8X methylmutase [Solirubrobacter ginsenosidimutans]|uniref:Precorrin-8X methylmutase n=1 Tax=Solirubrobacter ginsenosidimutans TaxID=490573 RepID=A0A9X3S1L0_9ACTN|nr:precorrin-8X methylmutase [Solirubrobacter ginsenosidimutans]MDA0162509.1 precorrin-8X methylmutase [Solirubrobacter ginsenosidimutans]
MARAIHPIERESYRILRSRIDLSHLPPLSRAVAERVIHAAADLSFGDSLVLDEQALRSGREALRDGAPIYTDARMVAAGITSRTPIVPLDDPRAKADATTTRSAAAMRLATHEAPANAIWVIGNAPTALQALLAHPPKHPALIVGLPVGFVGAAEAKAALAQSPLPHVTNVGERGGSAVAVAAVNALLYFEDEEHA